MRPADTIAPVKRHRKPPAPKFGPLPGEPHPRYVGGLDHTDDVASIIVFDRVTRTFVHEEQRTMRGQLIPEQKRTVGLMMANACLLFKSTIHFYTDGR